MTEEYNEEDLAKFLMQSQGYAMPEEKYNVHLFLHRVATADDTTKIGHLNTEEIGLPKHPVRTLKNMSLISDKIICNDLYKDYFTAKSEIILASSLSKEGFLVRQASTTTRQVADITAAKKAENKGWFKKKNKEETPTA